MTCIVGYISKSKKKNTVYMGIDSMGYKGDSYRMITDKKIIKKGDFLFGCCGSFRFMQLVKYSFTPPDIDKGQDVYEYMCTDFITELKNCLFSEVGEPIPGNEEFPTVDLMVAFRGRLFRVWLDFSVSEEVTDYITSGAGEDYAMGALDILEDLDLPTEDKITRALAVAERYCTSVRGPFHIESISYPVK